MLVCGAAQTLVESPGVDLRTRMDLTLHAYVGCGVAGVLEAIVWKMAGVVALLPEQTVFPCADGDFCFRQNHQRGDGIPCRETAG